jgi:hypothetical protein
MADLAENGRPICDPEDHDLVIYKDHAIVCAKCDQFWGPPNGTVDDLLDLMLKTEPGSPARNQVAAMLRQMERSS